MTIQTVSVVIVNHNAGTLLLDCVRSSLEQAVQVIVVDNDSSDSSKELLEEYFALEPRLAILSAGKNLGFAAGCNLGFNLATEPYVLFLNPDCVMGAQALQRMVSVMKNDARIGMVGGLLINPEGTEQGGARRAVPTPWRSFVRAFGLYRLSKRWPKTFLDFHLHKQPLPDRPVEVEAISGALMLVERVATKDVGLWDEAYFLHCEDLDWCMRFRQRGWKIMFVPDALVVHYRGVSSRSKPIFVEWHKHKGMMRFYRKFFSGQYPGLLMWLVSIGVWFRFSLVAGFYFFRRLVRKSEKRV